MTEATFSVARALAGKRILVVGGTGFLGKVWLAMLLHRFPQIGRVHLVVRAKKGASGEARFWADVASTHPFDALRADRPGAAFEAYLREKVNVVEADVTKAFCGFSPEEIAAWSGRIDAVVNVAGVVDFNPPLDEALLANAFGVQNLVNLAKALGDVPVLHTSTCYVAGYRAGHIPEADPLTRPFPKDGELDAVHWDPAREIAECLDLVEQAKHRANDSFRLSEFLDRAKQNLIKKGEPAQGSALENELARVRRKFLDDRLIAAGQERSKFWGFTNIYTYTKSIGEQILAASGLRYTIPRPAVIESSVEYPFPGWNEGINTMAPLIYLIQQGHIQVGWSQRSVLDVIPVDMVSAGMIVSLAKLLEQRAEKVYHLGSSDSNPFGVTRLIEIVGLHKRLHWQKKATGNPLLNRVMAHFEPVGLTPDEFYSRGALAIAKHTKTASSLVRSLGVGPLAALAKPVSKALSSYSDLARRNGEIWELYLPFMAETEYYFDCGNIRAAFAELSADERAMLPWYPERIDWLRYMHDVHIPGLEKWVWPEIDEKAKRPARPLRPHDSLLALLDEARAQHDLAVALSRFEDEGFTRVTFRDWHDRAGAAGARLAAVGVKPGDRVLLSGKNHPDWAIAYFGILRAGAVAVPVDPGLSEHAFANVFRASGSRVALTDDELFLGKARAAAPEGTTLVRLEDVAAADASLVAPAVTPPAGDDVASIIYTSGTTGDPKGVMLTHGNFTALLAALAPIFPLQPSDRLLSVLPLHHTFEFTCGLLLPLSRGSRVVYLDELNGERLARAMKEARVSAMVGVPALWQLLERKILAQVDERGENVRRVFDVAMTVNRTLGDKIGLNVGKVLFGDVHDALGGNIRYLISGGGALPPETARIFQGLGLPLAEGYGLTEAAPVLTVAKAGAKRGTVGKPVPGVSIKIDNPDANGVGEVLARGPNVMKGYAGNPEATAAVLTSDGWLRTGDLGRIDRKGTLTIVGRQKEVIVGTSGENVYPDDVERLLGDVPGVRELSIVGIADPRGGERVACLAVPEKGPDDESPEDRFARRDRAQRSLQNAYQKLGNHERPLVTMLYDTDLPRTATRKVKRKDVIEILDRLVAASSAPRTAGASVTSVVRHAVAAIARVEETQVTEQTKLQSDLHFDSLMTMELLAALEPHAQGRNLTQALAHVVTVGDLEGALAIVAEPEPAEKTPDDDDRELTIEVPEPLKDAAKAAISTAQRVFYGDIMKPRISGRAFIPHNRNTLVVANHASHLDMGLVRYALGTYGEDLVALAARDYFFDRNEIQRTILENFTNLAPIDRNAGLRESLREVGKLLDEGKTVLIFPEGTRSTDGSIREFKGAVGHLALHHQIDVLPVFLGGTYEAMPKNQLVPTKREVTARIGPPLEFGELRRLTSGLKPAAAARRVAELSQRAVESLRDGTALDLRRLNPTEAEPAKREHPLVNLFGELGRRFVPGRVEDPVSFYFTLGDDAQAKWTVQVSKSQCDIQPGKPATGSADCVLKTSAEMFTRIVREGYTPSVPEFMSGTIKSNNPMLLETFQKAFQLG